jgi:uncharacterized membrane protein YhaH (DUF805 family)
MRSVMWALAQIEDGSSASDGGGIFAALFGGVFLLVGLVVFVIVVAGMWKVFEKAGEPGWAAVIPIYNVIVLVKIAGREMWWVLLFLLPCANFVAAVMISLDIARKFGKDPLYGIGLAFLPFIFYPMLGFGDAQYNRNA